MNRSYRKRSSALAWWSRTLLLCASVLVGLTIPAAGENDYYTFENPFVRGSLVRAETVNSEFEAVEAGFDALPALSDVSDTYSDDAGAANAYVVTLDPAPVSYSTSTVVEFKAANANTGASSINVNALGTKAIKRYNGSDLSSGDIVTGQMVRVRYDGTNFKMIGVHASDVIAAAASASSASSSASAAATSASNASTSATTASGHASTASTHASNASTSASAAATAETNAETAETNAELAESNAETAEANAELAETNAETAETNAETAEANAEAAQAAAEAAAANSVPAGHINACIATSTGWLYLDGKTIGDASSGATGRANADTSALFTLLWNNLANAQAPVSGGRGASAAADFAAHKTIALPDARGRVIAAQDDMGGTAASRVLGVLSGSVDGDTLGATGGEEGHDLTIAEMPAHTHSQAIYQLNGDRVQGGGNNNTRVTQSSADTGSAGGGDLHNNMPPVIMLNFCIRI
jgi:microcystin-dependent protein